MLLEVNEFLVSGLLMHFSKMLPKHTIHSAQ